MDKKQLLYQSFLELETLKETENYLADLLTKAEIEEIADRLQIAYLLSEGKKYQFITKQTKASSTTIARVAKWLKGGQEGYKLILARLHHSQVTQTHL